MIESDSINVPHYKELFDFYVAPVMHNPDPRGMHVRGWNP